MITPATPRNSNRNIAPAPPSHAGRVFIRHHPSRVPSPRCLVLVGDRNYLRALRAAEMAAWEAGIAFDARKISIATGGGVS